MRSLSWRPFNVGNPLPEQLNLRFAVGTFDTWPQLREGLRDLRERGLVLDSFNCLALRRVFAGKTVVGPGRKSVAIQPLAFPDDPELTGCTSGPLADCLAHRLDSGSRLLEHALAHWLIPRHASHFSGAVQAGKILHWIRVADAEDERRAYQSLLAYSSDSVGVHDLVPPGK